MNINPFALFLEYITVPSVILGASGDFFEGIIWLIFVGFILIAILIVLVVVLGGTFGSIIGWNLSRNSKEDPDKIDGSEKNQKLRWDRLMISCGFGIAGIVLIFFAWSQWEKFTSTEKGFQDDHIAYFIVVGSVLGAWAAVWLQKKTNAKRNIKGNKGIVSMLIAGMFYGPVLLIIVVSPFGIPIVSLIERVEPVIKYEIKGDAVTITGCKRSESGPLTIAATIKGKPVTSIGGSTFSGCKSLTSITIPDSVTSIGGSAFSSCSSLTSITIPESVTSIAEWAFDSCTSLTSITIGNSVTSIGEATFYNCSSLTAVTFLGDAPQAADLFNDATPTIYRKPEAKGWGDTWGGRPVKLISEKP